MGHTSFPHGAALKNDVVYEVPFSSSQQSGNDISRNEGVRETAVKLGVHIVLSVVFCAYLPTFLQLFM